MTGRQADTVSRSWWGRSLAGTFHSGKLERWGTHGAKRAGDHPIVCRDPDFDALKVLLLQEVISEPGVQFLEDHGWTLVYGKNSREWRGTAVVFRSDFAKHTASALHHGGISTTLSFGGRKHQVRCVSGHIPHHATIAQTEHILGNWESALGKRKVVLGVDANETFTDVDDTGWRAHTGRGETFLTMVAQQCSLQGPQQQLDIPTYHPYNTAMESRRLDYLLVKGLVAAGGKVIQGSRHRARSDHDLVVLQLPINHRPDPARARPSWGGRRYVKGVDPTVEASLPPTQTDTHQAISQLAHRITEHGRPSQRYRESQEVRLLRAQARQATGATARDLWKQVSRQRKREHRAWHGDLVLQASQANWGAYRAIQQTKARGGWHHALMDEADWQAKLTAHFKGIFAKAPSMRTRRRLQDTRQALTHLCKHTQWRPFTGDELQLATRTWQRNKATGPDAITHELLQQLVQQPTWGGASYTCSTIFSTKASCQHQSSKA